MKMIQTARRALVILLTASLVPTATACLLGAASQEEVLKSINQSVGEGVDPTKFLSVLMAMAGVIMALVIVAQWMKRKQRRPATVNHSGKLLKEMAIKLRLRSNQIRQLKAMAAEKELDSPLLLILCPSLRQTNDVRTQENLRRAA